MFLLTLQSLHFSDMIEATFLHILQRAFALPALGINYYHESVFTTDYYSIFYR